MPVTRSRNRSTITQEPARGGSQEGDVTRGAQETIPSETVAPKQKRRRIEKTAPQDVKMAEDNIPPSRKKAGASSAKGKGKGKKAGTGASRGKKGGKAAAVGGSSASGGIGEPSTSTAAPKKAVVPSAPFSIGNAKEHMKQLDPRWGDVFELLKCKPYEDDAGNDKTERENAFQSLCVSILSQQISWKAARSVTHSFVRLFFPHLPPKLGPPGSRSHPEFPTPSQILSLPDCPTFESKVSKLRTAGLSQMKAKYILSLSEHFENGELSDDILYDEGLAEEELIEKLTKVKGIGVWTAHMFSIFTLRRPDILPVGDLGIQKGLLKWYSADPSKPPPIMKERLNCPLETMGDEQNPSDAAAIINAAKAESQDPSNPHPDGLTPKNPVEKILLTTPLTTTNGKKRKRGDGEDDGAEAEAEEMEVDANDVTELEGRRGYFPSCPQTGLTREKIKAKLAKSKVKGGGGGKQKGAYLTPLEMEELTNDWRPYRSIGTWYLWSLTDQI